MTTGRINQGAVRSREGFLRFLRFLRYAYIKVVVVMKLVVGSRLSAGGSLASGFDGYRGMRVRFRRGSI